MPLDEKQAELESISVILNNKKVNFSVKVIASDLSFPWSVAELPDNSLLVTEKTGKLKHLKNDGSVSTIKGLPSLYVKSQGGLLDLVLHPNFSENQTLFISYAHGSDEANTTRLMSAKLANDTLVDEKVLFEVEPYKDTPVHFGGRIAVLPDNMLVMTTGDGFDYREQAQRLDSLLGKSVRLTFDGRIPQDNPFTNQASARSEIWSYGHRNPQGLVYDPLTSQLWMHEHGPAGGDEINIISAGANYGWPVITQGKDYSGALITPFKEYEGMQQPKVNWTPSIAPSGMDIYRSSSVPELEGALLIGALVDRCIYIVFPEKSFEQIKLLESFNYRIRDILIRKNGNILVLTDSQQGKLLELTPKAESNE
ncbi:MAG: PQQ-dependent sugar dehydrogenase [Gammaproteobacteria bacterium]|nr:PQQ-dependent sugar dehydrogenase [Gammaproteobacteria bacterium]